MNSVKRVCQKFMSIIRRKKKARWIINLLFSTVIFSIITITMIIITSIFYVLDHFNILHNTTKETPIIALIIFIISSIVMGTFVGTLLSRIPLKPFYRLIDGMTSLSQGNYDVTIEMGRAPIFKEISHNFNKMAKELNETEVLRTDFINNLSHEFKTPIVSISGFAKILQKTELTAEQREFVDIIASESNRLTKMTTNVLALSKIENQHILTNTTNFNLSEQIRESIILLERSWSEKELDIKAEFGEIYLTANEELLKQVWINLIDNSIKYSPNNKTITCLINDYDEFVRVIIGNNGPKIDPHVQKQIFRKYWQEDLSHATEGTGIGLSIAKSIVDLHEGVISVQSSDKETQFIVDLPKNKTRFPKLSVS